MTSIVTGVRPAVERDKHDNTHYSAASAVPLRNQLLSTKGQVQNVPASRVYVFGNADLAEDELNADSQDSIEMSELRPRAGMAGKVKTKTKNVEPLFIERDIEAGDTLQIFALQFGCPMSELKRCNNLVSDQDFFALKKIKIPIKQHGLLTEEAEQKRRRPNALPKTEPSEDHLMNGGFVSNDDDESDWGEEDNLLVKKISIRDCMRDETTAKQFLRKMDQDLEKIRLATQTQKSSLEEVTSTLTETRIHPLLLPYFQKRKKRTYCDNATCGMTSSCIIIFGVLIVVAVPILISIYYLLQK